MANARQSLPEEGTILGGKSLEWMFHIWQVEFECFVVKLTASLNQTAHVSLLWLNPFVCLYTNIAKNVT